MSERSLVYFLTVEHAKQIAERHERDETWDIWGDEEAQLAGCVAKYDKTSPYNIRRAS
jgi:hypothetical protein